MSTALPAMATPPKGDYASRLDVTDDEIFKPAMTVLTMAECMDEQRRRAARRVAAGGLQDCFDATVAQIGYDPLNEQAQQWL